MNCFLNSKTRETEVVPVPEPPNEIGIGAGRAGEGREQVAAVPVGDFRLLVHDQQWFSRGEVTVDASTRTHTVHFKHFDDIRSAVRRPIDYFWLMYPMGTLEETLAQTNAFEGMVRQGFTLTAQLYWRWLGIRLMMTLERRKLNIDECWRITKEHEFSLLEPANYGQRFGMSKDNFKAINSSFRFCRIDETTLSEVFYLFIHCKYLLKSIFN